MSYIGKAPGFGIRNRYYYTATASQTLFSGADDNGQTLAYADSKYLDVYLNGVLLVAGTDYTATTLTSVSLTSGAAADDIIEIVAYDIFSVADTVSAANGGTFNGAVTFADDVTVNGAFTSQGIDDNADATAVTIDSSERVLVGPTSTIPINNNSMKFQIAGTTYDTSAMSIARFVNSNGNPSINFGKTRSGTIGTVGTIVNDDDSLGGIAFCGDDGVDIASRAATISAEVDGTPGADDMPGRLVFSTTADGSNSQTERMRITNEGEVIIGDTTTANSKLFVGGGVNTGDNGLAVADSTEASGYKMLCLTPPSIPNGGSISMVFTGFVGDAPYSIKFRYGGFSGAVTQPGAHCGFSVEYCFNGPGNMNSVTETFEYGDSFNSGDVAISGSGSNLTFTIQHHGAHSSSIGFRCWLIAEVYGFAAQRVYLQSQS